MRIAFISANRERMPDAVIPIGILSVMAATPGHHEKVFWDLCFETDPLRTVARDLREFQPDLVAIGLRNLQNMDYTSITLNLDEYRALIQAVRANSAAPIVLGGGGFSVTPQALMEDLGADFGIVGEGERAFATLLDALERPEPLLREVERLYVRAGAAGMEIGSDSGCDEMLDRPRKGFRTDKIRRLSTIARAHGLRDCHSFILGTTGETLEHVERTLDFVEDLDPFAAVRRLGLRRPLWQHLDRQPARRLAAGIGPVARERASG